MPLAVAREDTGEIVLPPPEEILEAGAIPPNPDQPPATTPPEEVDALFLAVKEETIRQQEAGSALEAGLPVDERTNEEIAKDNMTSEIVEGAPPEPPLEVTDPQNNPMKTLRNMTAEVAEGEPSPEEPPPEQGEGPPVVVWAPMIEQVGNTVTCTMGIWEGVPTAHSYQWRFGGANFGEPTSEGVYTLVGNEAGFEMDCVLTASNNYGSADSTSNTITIA